MAAINQRIPNFLGGVSQQPDTIKFPGQLRVCDNAVPDVTFGLTKRPPGEFVGKLANANSTGYWYDIIRDDDEKYLLKITPGNTGSIPIRIWDLADGTECALTNSSGDAIFSYLSGATKPYDIQSVQDYTIITNPDKTVAESSSNVGGLIDSGDYAFVRLDTVAYNTEYAIYRSSDHSGTAPNPNTYYTVKSIKVERQNGDGETWIDTASAQTALGQYAGQKEWKTTVTCIEQATGNLAVNGTNFIKSHTEHTDGGNVSGYTPNYGTQYTVAATLKDGGRFATDPVPSGTSTVIGDNITIENVMYDVKAQSSQAFKTYEGVANVAYYRTPKSPDYGNLGMGTILEGLADGVNALSGLTATVVGNGIYITGTNASKINFVGGTVNEGMTVISKTATNVARLPSQCKNGYIVQVDNSENVDSDNYYLQFRSDGASNDTSDDEGPGKWEEVACPHGFIHSENQRVGLDTATMPHALINNRTSPNTFTFKKLDVSSSPEQYWKNKDVGDHITNPMPSLVGQKIQQLFFHRNRLGLVANEQIVMSRPGDYFNLFSVSAITTSADNPIDITVSDVKPAYIHHTLPIQKGVMMLSDNGQFLLFTESDEFSAKTVRLKKVSSYEADNDIAPVDMGTSVMWPSSVGPFTRTYEAVILDDDVPPKVVEQTRVVPEFLPNSITLATNSAALGMVTYCKKGDSSLYHYKYFDSGERRDQSAWFSWTITGTLEHALYTGGDFYTATKQGSDYVLSRYEYTTDASANRSYTLGSGTVGSATATSRWFEACLDNMVIPSAISYTAQGGSVTGPDFTDLTLGYTPTSADNFYAVALSGTDSEGNDVAGTVVKATSVGTNKATFEDVNMTGWVVAAGYRYTSIIELPSYYASQGQNQNDLDGELRISGINFEMGVSGPMEFHLSSEYADMDDYIQYESGMKLDDSDFGKPPAKLMKSVRVPIQRKNEKYKLQIKIPDPFSTALISASWDGRYNTKRHVRK